MNAIHTNTDYNTPPHIYICHTYATHINSYVAYHIYASTYYILHSYTCHINTSHTIHTRHIPHYTPSLTDAHTTSIHTHHIYTQHINILCT